MWEHFASLAPEQNLLDGFLTAHPFSCLCILGCPDTGHWWHIFLVAVHFWVFLDEEGAGVCHGNQLR